MCNITSFPSLISHDSRYAHIGSLVCRCIGVGNVNTVKISDMSIKTKEGKTQTKCLFSTEMR